MVAILSKFTVFCQSYFVVYFLKLKLIFFYNRVVYHYPRIFLIFLLHPMHGGYEWEDRYINVGRIDRYIDT